jgi:hypothetical protein
MGYRRRKPRRKVRCRLCTDARTGNSASKQYADRRVRAGRKFWPKAEIPE